MKDLFLARLALEMHLPSDTFWELMRPLAGCFPNSIYIKSQLAAACYDMFGKCYMNPRILLFFNFCDRLQ